DFGFPTALAAVKNSIHLSLYEDETSLLCQWHVPQAHFLEAWTDARAADGSVRIGQPLIEPLFGGLTATELLAMFTGNPETESSAIVRATLKEYAPTEPAWNKAVHDGRVDGSAFERTTPQLQPIAPLKLSDWELSGEKVAGALELQFEFDGKVLDGR